MRSLEAAVAEITRVGHLRYGCCTAGTWYLRIGPLFADAVAGASDPRQWSQFIHPCEDAARAAMLAIDWPAGVFQ
jgi:hypothetical protein